MSAIYDRRRTHCEIVRLLKSEKDYGIGWGYDMEMKARSLNLKDKYGYNGTLEDSMNKRKMSQVTELALRKGLGYPLDLKMDAFGQEDAPGNIQVRHITGDHHGLIVRDDDDPMMKVVGVIMPVLSKHPEHGAEITIAGTDLFILAGWCYVWEAREAAGPKPYSGEKFAPAPHPEYWRTFGNGRPPVISVAQEDLHSMDSLREVLASRGHITTKDNLV